MKLPFLIIVVTAVICGVCTWFITANIYQKRIDGTAAIVKGLDSTLESCNEIIRQSSKQIINEWNNNQKDPGLFQVSTVLLPKINGVISATQSMNLYIENIKNKIKKAAAYNKNDDDSYNYKDINVSNKLMIGEMLTTSLKDSLNNLVENIYTYFNVKERHSKGFPIENLLHNKTKGWWETNFTNISALTCISLLTKIQNDVLRSGYIAALRIQESVAIDRVVHHEFEGLAFINSSYLLPGETLEITAGVGSFSTDGNPIIKIDGKEQKLDVNGMAIYNKIAKGSGGAIPISISYMNPNTGARATIYKTISYKVAKP